jgi:mono/diheme cytochrome c family protein
MTERGFQIALVASLLVLPTAASSEDGANGRTFSSGYRFVEMSGEELFANVCQGCHMPNAAGATGAGIYPSLVSDKNLLANGYTIDLIVNGRRAMPPFGDMMSDAQIAAVVNYLRTHFDNDYHDVVTAKDVKEARR